jgi:glycine hydroxymethyltransferase
MHIIAAKAVAFGEALDPSFKDYCGRVISNAQKLAATIASQGFKIVSGGTDNHLFLLSLVGREVTGKVAQLALDDAGITANKNMVPFDPRKPMVTSGIRIGTPAVTTRGMGAQEMEQIGGFIARVLEQPEDDGSLAAIRSDVEALCRKFPLYPQRWADTD